MRILLASLSAEWLFEHFSEFDEFLHLLASRDALERTFAGHGLGLGPCAVAVAADARDNARALHALGKSADKVDSRLSLVLCNLRIGSHCVHDSSTAVPTL